MTKDKTKIYFPNLDGLRFIAFFAVFVHHAVFVKKSGLDESTAVFRFLDAQEENGTLGVNLFFVLSGFLITYLLLQEKKQFKSIQVLHFYMRRVLRIWPLYFAMVFIGFVVFPLLKSMLGEVPNETHTVDYYLLFVSNFQMISKGFADASILNILWSVGIEEQFYVVWPLVLLLVPVKHIVKLFFAFIMISLVFRYYHANDTQVIYFHTLSVISDMVVGGLAAYASMYSERFRNLITHLSKNSIVVIYLIGALLIMFNYLLFTGTWMIMIERLLLSFFFVFVILEQNYSLHSFYKMSNNKFLSKWGNYTYGLYCLHTIGLLTAYVITSKVFQSTHPLVMMGASFLIGLPVSMFLSYYSYHFFESPFLKLKNKFTLFTKDK